jgi:hypothetical protein
MAITDITEWDIINCFEPEMKELLAALGEGTTAQREKLIDELSKGKYPHFKKPEVVAGIIRAYNGLSPETKEKLKDFI